MNRRQFNKKILIGLGSSVIAPIIYNNNTNTDMKKCLKPKALAPGDTIGLITPSSSITEAKLEKAIANMKMLGLKVKLGKHIKAINGYLAGTDEQRLEDLHNMFADDEVDGIWCIRGGYGVGRILPKINYKLIKKNPKVLIGYSDITALLLAIYQKTGLIGFHGPLASSEFTDYSVKHLKGVLMNPQMSYTIGHAKDSDDSRNKVYHSKVIRSGKAEGKLTGGNLTLLAAAMGTNFQPKFKNKLVFIEDIGERPYRLDRMFTQILQGSDLHKAAGIILGVFADCEAKEGSRSLSLMEMFEDRLGHLGIPIIYGLSLGHIKNHMTLPVGIEAKIDADKRTVTLLERAVK
ncbi:MAG: LD-carboxypeptidase [Saprospiraceae bacterium]